MKTPDPVCIHLHHRVEEWDHGRDPGTGYLDAGTMITCLDCKQHFTVEEFEHERATWERDSNPEPGDVYEQFGARLVVIDCGGDDLFYVARDGAYTGPLRSVKMSHFRRLLQRRIVTRVPALQGALQ
jgi:hypothetical protein